MGNGGEGVAINAVLTRGRVQGGRWILFFIFTGVPNGKPTDSFS